MPLPSTRQLLRRHAIPFTASFVGLTTLLVANYAARGVASGAAGSGSSIERVFMAIPFTAAMTIPMSVFVAVLWVFTRLGRDGVLALAQREAGGVRRLVAPVLGAAAVVAALNVVVNTQVVPRANARLAALHAGGAVAPSDRTMTIGELRREADVARANGAPATRVGAYEVEIHKKLALAAACIVLALAAIASAMLAPRGGTLLVVGASCLVLGAYYAALVTGETLADRLVLSPFAAMWMANLVLAGIAALVLWRGRSAGTSHARESLAVGA